MFPDQDSRTPDRDDCRRERLLLRNSEYKKEVKTLYNKTMDQDEDPYSHWGRAQTTAAEMRARFLDLFPEEREKLPLKLPLKLRPPHSKSAT